MRRNGVEELDLSELLEKLKELGLGEEALSIIKATLLIISRKEFREREETEFISKLMKKYGIEVPF